MCVLFVCVNYLVNCWFRILVICWTCGDDYSVDDVEVIVYCVGDDVNWCFVHKTKSFVCHLTWPAWLWHLTKFNANRVNKRQLGLKRSISGYKQLINLYFNVISIQYIPSIKNSSLNIASHWHTTNWQIPKYINVFTHVLFPTTRDCHYYTHSHVLHPQVHPVTILITLQLISITLLLTYISYGKCRSWWIGKLGHWWN